MPFLYRVSPYQLFSKCTVYHIYGKQDWISIRGRFREILLLVFECNQAVKNELRIYLYICLKQERDPFWEPDDAEVLIGSAHVYLQSLAYKVCLLAFISKYLDALKLRLH